MGPIPAPPTASEDLLDTQMPVSPQTCGVRNWARTSATWASASLLGGSLRDAILEPLVNRDQAMNVKAKMQCSGFFLLGSHASEPIRSLLFSFEYGYSTPVYYTYCILTYVKHGSPECSAKDLRCTRQSPAALWGSGGLDPHTFHRSRGYRVPKGRRPLHVVHLQFLTQ